MLLACLWTTEKTFGDTSNSVESQIVYQAVLEQPEEILAMVGRVFIANADQKVQVYDISQRDAPILEETVELNGTPKALLNLGSLLIFVTDTSIQLRTLNTLNTVQEWEATETILDAVLRPTDNSILVLLESSPITLQEFEIVDNTITPTSSWSLNVDEPIVQMAAYTDGVAMTDRLGNVFQVSLSTGDVISVPPVAEPLTQFIHVTEHPFILHSTGNNGLRVYDTQLTERNVWPPLGEVLATTSLEQTIYTTSTGEFIVLEMDETAQLNELWRTDLKAGEKPSTLYVDRGFAYSIDRENGFFSIIDTIR